MIIIQAGICCQIPAVIDVNSAVYVIVRRHILTSDCAFPKAAVSGVCFCVNLTGQDRMFLQFGRKQTVAVMFYKIVGGMRNIFSVRRGSRLKQHCDIIGSVMPGTERKWHAVRHR